VATTTLTGTTGNNLLNAPGSVSTLVQGLQGNDTINLALVNDEAQGGQGNDTIGITNSGVAANTIFAGDGQDTVTINSASQFTGYINLGDGNDVVQITTVAGAPLVSNAQIYGDLGNDTLSLANAFVSSTIGGGEGNDSLSFTAGAFTNSLVNGGKQRDTITLNNAASSFSTVQAGQGNDIISLTGANLGAYTNSLVGGGKGNDSIALGTIAISTVAGGGLSDTITIVANYAGGVVYGDGLGVTTSGTGTEGAADGADKIGNSATTFAGATSIYGAGGNDTIDFASFVVAGLVDGGDNADAIGNTSSTFTTSGASLFGGSGLDTIKLATLATSSNLMAGGDGADSIWLGDNLIGSINGGSGNDTISVVGAAEGLIGASVTVNGGTGSDSIVFSGAANGVTMTAGGSLLSAGLIGNVAYEGGDKIALATALSTSATNWAVPSSTIWVLTGAFAILTNTGISATNGSVAVYSDNTDTYIYYSLGTAGAASLISGIRVSGADLVNTTATGQVALNSTNFGFSLASVTGTTGVAGSNGINITLV